MKNRLNLLRISALVTHLLLAVLPLAPALFAPSVASAEGQAEWQFAVDLVDIPEPHVHAAMWIPPSCPHVRGILLGEQVILETRVMEHPSIRAAGTAECLAFVLMNHSAYGEFNYDPKAAPELRDDLRLQKVLDLLATDSGYAEVATAPLLPVGHSGAAVAVWRIGYWSPSRTIAMIGLHAAAIHPPAWDPRANVNGVPFLGISGEYESWGDPEVPLDMHWRWLRGTVLEMRASQKRALMSILVDPGAGHFSFSDAMADYLARFIMAACDARLPQPTATNAAGIAPPTLRQVPLESGWLTDETPLEPGPNQHPTAPWTLYSGDRSRAFWHLTRELALANEDFQRDQRGKKQQMVACGFNRKLLPAEWLIPVPFEPGADGQTVTLDAGFLSVTPPAAANSGHRLGHAAGPIKMALIGGWGGGNQQTGPHQFRIIPGLFGPNDSLIVLVYHPGDPQYSYAEAACQVKFRKMEDDGAAQTLDFAQIANRPAGPAMLALDAKASSGLPVQFYVIRGPATVEGSTLRLTQPPLRARYPIRVTVGALERGAPGKWKAAGPLERTFLLTRP